MASRKPRKQTFKPRIFCKSHPNLMKLGGKLRTYPVNISPRDLALKIFIAREFRDEIKRGGVFSRTQEIQFERARDSRGFGIGLEARESQQKARRILAIMCTKNEIKIHHTRHKTRGLNQNKSPEGTRRIGPPFPIKSHSRSQQSMDKIYSKERNRGRKTQGRRPGEQNNSRTSSKSLT